MCIFGQLEMREVWSSEFLIPLAWIAGIALTLYLLLKPGDGEE